jgi:hypothetical protein
MSEALLDSFRKVSVPGPHGELLLLRAPPHGILMTDAVVRLISRKGSNNKSGLMATSLSSSAAICTWANRNDNKGRDKR